MVKLLDLLWFNFSLVQNFSYQFNFYFPLSYCCGASVVTSSNIIRIWEEYIEGDTNSRIHHFLPECIAFNQDALRHVLPECIAPQTILGCHDRCHIVEPSSFFAWILVVMFCSDLPVKRCEGDRAWISQLLLLFLMQHVKVCNSGRLIVTS